MFLNTFSMQDSSNSQQSLKKKTPSYAMTGLQRVQAIEMLAKESNTKSIFCEPIACLTKEFIPVKDAEAHLQDKLNKLAKGSEFEVFKIFGVDHLDLAARLLPMKMNIVLL